MRTVFRYSMLVCASFFSAAFPSGRASAADDVKAIVAKLISSREEIRTADVTIRGRQYRLDKAGKTLSEQPVFEHLLFDFVIGNASLERELQELALVKEHRDAGLKQNPEKPGTKQSPNQQNFVAGTGVSLFRSGRGTKIEIFNRASQMSIWDPRTFGMATFDDLTSFTSLGDYSITLMAAESEGRLSVRKGVAPGILELEMRFGTPDSKGKTVGRRTISIDTARRFVPIKVVDQFKVPGDEEEQWMEPHGVGSATWSLISEVYVPTSAKAEFVSNHAKSRISAAGFELALEWNALNQPIDEKAFTVEALDVPKGSHLVVDRRRPGQSVIVQHPGIPDPRMLESMNAKPQPLNADTKRKGGAFWVTILVGINVVALLVAVGVWWFKARVS